MIYSSSTRARAHIANRYSFFQNEQISEVTRNELFIFYEILNIYYELVLSSQGEKINDMNLDDIFH
jgi:hypothetical protein